MKTWLRLLTVSAVVVVMLLLNIGSAAAKSFGEKFNEALSSWVGEDINMAIQQFGPPTSVYTSPNGDRTFSWITVGGTTMTGEVTRDLFGEVNVNSQSRQNSCRKSLVVGKQPSGVGILLAKKDNGNGIMFSKKRDDLMVFSVSSNTPASQAGVQAGDIIVEAFGRTVTNEWLKTLPVKFFDSISEGEALVLVVRRKKVKELLRFELKGVLMKDRVTSFSWQGCF